MRTIIIYSFVGLALIWMVWVGYKVDRINDQMSIGFVVLFIVWVMWMDYSTGAGARKIRKEHLKKRLE